jgi:hypothetical protein
VLSAHRFTDFELIRDGGSLMAAFDDEDGGCHFLFFHIRSVDGPGPNEATHLGFERPVVLNFETNAIEVSVTWPEAAALLDAAARSPDLEPRKIEGLSRMLRVAEREGHEPARTVKTFCLTDLPADRADS